MSMNEFKSLTWQPIETAPKDGTRFLGSSKGCETKLYYWNSEKNRFLIEHQEEIGWTPTHWFPLPIFNQKAISLREVMFFAMAWEAGRQWGHRFGLIRHEDEYAWFKVGAERAVNMAIPIASDSDEKDWETELDECVNDLFDHASEQAIVFPDNLIIVRESELEIDE